MAHMYDAIVIGLGGVGSAAIKQLAERGLQVLGIEQFQLVHDLGSSHGETRLIRQAYFEHPDYVPLLKRAYSLWDQLENETEEKLFFRVGLVEVGPLDGAIIPGVTKSATEHRLAIEQWNASECHAQFPQFRIPEDYHVVFESNAGFLLVEECVRQHLKMAERLGVPVLQNEKVLELRLGEKECQVITQDGTFICQKLIITVGPWISELVQFDVAFRILRKHLYWFECPDPQYDVNNGFPGFLFEMPHGHFYGFPAINAALKLAEHTGGDVVKLPTHVDRSDDQLSRSRVEAFLAHHLPGVSQKLCDHKVCMYTMSPDDHFVVDQVRDFPNVVVATGLSGHGFKFCPAIAQNLVQRLFDPQPEVSTDFLRLRRFTD